MSNTEQRKHQRHTTPVGTIVYTTESMGQILNISPGGFAIKYLFVETPISKQKNIDILLGGTLLSDVPVTVAWESNTTYAIKDNVKMSRVGLKFDNLTAHQKNAINSFIAEHLERKEEQVFPLAY